jgi:pSer/pThr/pTyr-binding forkhead associated (FHA) protein
LARLVWEREDGSRVDYVLSGDVMVVGRDPAADICVDEVLVSRVHARVERRGESFFLLDLGSTNMTRVNGELVLERELRHGDEVRFGRARCLFLTDGGPDPVANGV